MDGYSRLAKFMGTYRGEAIYRRFRTLHNKVLLSRQAELVHLQAELDIVSRQDRYSHDAKRERFEYVFASLKEASVDERGRDQWNKLLEIRQKLKEYGNNIRLP